MTERKFLQVAEIYANQGNSLSGLSILVDEFKLYRTVDVYHYTDISGFISIMLNQELWASHITFMNDKTEYLHGKELFRKKLIEKINTVQEMEQEVLKNVLNGLDKEMSDSILPTSSKNVFSISFTYSKDSLEMWRGYGKESGIAVGFEWAKCQTHPGMCLIRKEIYEKLLEKYDNKPEIVCPEGNLLFVPLTILYSNDKKDKLVEKVINMGLNCFRYVNKNSECPQLAILNATQFLSDLIFKINPFLKHDGYKGEKECRLVDSFTIDEGQEQVYYRNRGGIILPYAKYKLMDINCRPLKKMPISEIIVGPGSKQQRVIDSVRYFLDRNKMDYLVDKVRASTIPYVEM